MGDLNSDSQLLRLLGGGVGPIYFTVYPTSLKLCFKHLERKLTYKGLTLNQETGAEINSANIQKLFIT